MKNSRLKTLKINRAAAVCKLLANTNNGLFFGVTYFKKDGSIRNMLARKGVQKGLKGVGMKYTPLDKALMGVWDVHKAAYRMINLDQLISFNVNGIKYEVV
jgi:hypothetical protein